MYKTIARILLFLIAASLLPLLSSCYTKKRAIEKFCSPTSYDSTIVLHDTIVVDSISHDTVFHARIDTVELTKDKLTIKYIRVKDSIYLSGEYAGDTIVRHDTVMVTIPFNCPKVCPATLWERIYDARWFVLVSILLGMAFMGYLKLR